MLGSSVRLVGRTKLRVREFGELSWSHRVKC